MGGDVSKDHESTIESSSSDNSHDIKSKSTSIPSNYKEESSSFSVEESSKEALYTNNIIKKLESVQTATSNPGHQQQQKQQQHYLLDEFCKELTTQIPGA